VVLDWLSPAERVAFVLHDMFAVPFDEIAPIVGRSPTAAKMLASRARRRVRRAVTAPDAGLKRQREVVAAFLAASREDDFEGLLAVLDPDIVLRSDGTAVRAGAPREIRGAPAVRRSRVGSRRTAASRIRLHDHAREDRRNRHTCQPRTPRSARPGGPRRLALSAASR
jgi:Sigma-70, region 4